MEITNFLDEFLDSLSLEDKRYAAHHALVVLIACHIRYEIGDDKDRSGPEDAAEIIAEKFIKEILDGAAWHWREVF